MTLGIVTISSFTLSPTSDISTDSEIYLRGWYSRSFVAGDGSTPVESGNGQDGFYYNILCSLNASNEVVIPAFDVWATTLSNPTANFTAQLWVDGSPSQTVMPQTPEGSGWQIPTLYGDTITFAELATYNRARRLLYPPSTYLTADDTITLIEQLAGNFDYMAVGINGIGSIDTAPASASLPIVIGTNSRRASDFYNIIAYGAATSKTAAQNATAIAAAVTAAALTGGGIYIPVGTFSTNSVTISVPVEFAPGTSILSPATGQTVTITKTITADASKHFGNATAGLGTISFSGNTVLTEAWWQWWGAAPSATATVNSAAWNACNAALCTVGAGDIILGQGTYDGNGIQSIGSDAIAFTGIGVKGSNGVVGTKLRWTGATNGTFLYLTRGRFNHLRDFQITSSVALGTVNGLRISGPNTGTNTSGVVVDRVEINTFNIGLLIGDGSSGGHDASEISVNDSTFESCNTGLRIDGQNSIGLHLTDVNFGTNTNLDLDLVTGSETTINGGSWGATPVNIKIGQAGVALTINGVRPEMGAGQIFVQSNASNVTCEVTMTGCELESSDITTALLQGVAAWNLIGNRFGSVGAAVIPIMPNHGSMGNGASVTMIGNLVNENSTLMTSDANSVGTTYTFLNNLKLKNDGNANGKWDDETGVIDISGNRVVLSKIVWSGVSGLSQLRLASIVSIANSGKLNIAPKTNDSWAATIALDVTISNHVIAAVFGTSSTATINGSAGGTAGDILFISTENGVGGSVVVTFGTNFKSSGTQTTTASHFSTIIFQSDGTRFLEISRTTNLA